MSDRSHGADKAKAVGDKAQEALARIRQMNNHPTDHYGSTQAINDILDVLGAPPYDPSEHPAPPDSEAPAHQPAEAEAPGA